MRSADPCWMRRCSVCSLQGSAWRSRADGYYSACPSASQRVFTTAPHRHVLGERKHAKTRQNKNRLWRSASVCLWTSSRVGVHETLPEHYVCVHEHTLTAMTQEIGQTLSKHIKYGGRQHPPSPLRLGFCAAARRFLYAIKASYFYSRGAAADDLCQR